MCGAPYKSVFYSIKSILPFTKTNAVTKTSVISQDSYLLNLSIKHLCFATTLHMKIFLMQFFNTKKNIHKYVRESESGDVWDYLSFFSQEKNLKSRRIKPKSPLIALLSWRNNWDMKEISFAIGVSNWNFYPSFDRLPELSDQNRIINMYAQVQQTSLWVTVQRHMGPLRGSRINCAAMHPTQTC